MIKSGVNTEGARAGEPWSHVICDHTKIILNDGVTLYPGYLSIEDGKLFQHFSDDPNNTVDPFIVNDRGEAIGKNPAFSLTMLKNRVEFERVEGPITAPEGAPVSGHFLDFDVLHHFIEAQAGQVEETVVGDVSPDSEIVIAETIAVVEEAEPLPVESTDEPATEPVSDGTDTQTESPSPEPSVDPAPVEPTETTDVTPPAEDTPTPEPIDETPIVIDEPAPSAEPDAPETPETPSPETPAPDDSVSEIQPSDSPADGGSEDSGISEEPETAAETLETDEPHLIDVGGIQRCSVCMRTAAGLGGPEEIASHMNEHMGIAPEPAPEPTSDMMTTETHS